MAGKSQVKSAKSSRQRLDSLKKRDSEEGRKVGGGVGNDGLPIPTTSGRMRRGKLYNRESVRMKAQALLDTLLAEDVRQDSAMKILSDDATREIPIRVTKVLTRKWRQLPGFELHTHAPEVRMRRKSAFSEGLK